MGWAGMVRAVGAEDKSNGRGNGENASSIGTSWCVFLEDVWLASDFTGRERDNARFDAAMERVIRALRTGDGGRELPPVPLL